MLIICIYIYIYICAALEGALERPAVVEGVVGVEVIQAFFMCVYMYICIERERERDNVYIYIYTYIERER